MVLSGNPSSVWKLCTPFLVALVLIFGSCELRPASQPLLKQTNKIKTQLPLLRKSRVWLQNLPIPGHLIWSLGNRMYTASGESFLQAVSSGDIEVFVGQRATVFFLLRNPESRRCGSCQYPTSLCCSARCSLSSKDSQLPARVLSGHTRVQNTRNSLLKKQGHRPGINR